MLFAFHLLLGKAADGGALFFVIAGIAIRVTQFGGSAKGVRRVGFGCWYS